MKKGQILELEIVELTKKGKGKAFLNQRVFEIPHCIPGQVVKAKVIKKKRSIVQAKLVEVLKKAPNEILPKCLHFGQPPDEEGRGCGGCSWQMVSYDTQLKYKEALVMQALKNIPCPEIESIIPSPLPFHYRNKMEWSFGDKGFISETKYLELRTNKLPLPTGFYLGFHPPGSYSSVIDLNECYLVSEDVLTLFQALKAYVKANGGSPYSTYSQSGFWRYLVIRESHYHKELMIHICTTDEINFDFNPFSEIVNNLDLSGKKVVSIQHSINNSTGQSIGRNPPELIFGRDNIKESLCDLTFKVSAHSFFQANTLAAELLYEKVIDYCDLSGGETIYDLYCGTGTIGLLLAKHGAKHVIGIEEVQVAVEDANKNANLNQIHNCTFVCGKVEKELQKYLDIHSGDIVILDPPRGGLHPRTIQLLRELTIKKIIYVSCNPYALAQDLSKLLPEKYEINRMSLVDLFPQTPHIETIVELVLTP